MPGWVDQAVTDYCKRLPRECSVSFVDISLGYRAKGGDTLKAIRKEGEQMLAALSSRERVIALDVKGKLWSTEQLAQNMSDWQMSGDDIALLVGGPDGLAQECLQRANQSWSLSPLTLPHPLVRVLLAEQLYRGWSILKGHPYHK